MDQPSNNPPNKKSKSGDTFDITQIGNDEPEQLATAIEQFYKNDGSVKTRLSYNWERNQLMLDGHQWLVFDGTYEGGGQWKRLSVSKANDYIPRPVTKDRKSVV